MIKEWLFSRALFPLTELAAGSRFWSRYHQVLNSLSLHERQRLQSQQTRLANLLKLAGEQVDIWRETFYAVGIDTNTTHAGNADAMLDRLSIAQKSTFANGFPDRVTVKQNADRWQCLSSAGTTGRMTVVTDFAKRDYLRAAEHVNLKAALDKAVGCTTLDIPSPACNVVCGFADEGPESLMAYLFWCIRRNRLFDAASLSDIRGRVERQVLLNRKTLLPIEPGHWQTVAVQLDAYLDQIINQKKQVIRGLPHFLLWLAARAEQRQLQFPHVKFLIPYGGLAAEALTSRISRAFSARFINFYGTGEIGAIGGTFEHNSDALDICQELVYLEIINDRNKRVADGEVGRIVVTDLTNKAMPIIRYDIGDIGYLEHDADSCRSRLKLLGRKQECFIAESGRLITTRDLQNLFFDYPPLVNFKLEQIANARYKLALVCVNTEQHDLSKDILPLDKISLGKLAEAFKRLLCADPQQSGVEEESIQLKVKQVPFITPETSGKYVAFKDFASID